MKKLFALLLMAALVLGLCACTSEPVKSDFELAEAIGRRRGFLISGGEVDFLRTSNMLLDEFRGGKIGKITIEIP